MTLTPALGTLPSCPATDAVRFSIVDDHVLVREGLVAVLQDPRLKLIGAFSSLEEFLQHHVTTPPEARTSLLLLDLDLHGKGVDLDLVTALMDGGVQIIVVSAMGVPRLVRELVTAGVSGFVTKGEPTSILFEAIEAVLDGGTWTTPRLAAILMQSPERPVLSPQEERALMLYATGMKMSSVARRLGVQPDTAKVYIDRVRKKYAALGREVRTKTDLYIAATEDGLISKLR